MLNEIIRGVGYENIIKVAEEDIDMTNSLYVGISLDRKLNIEEDALLIKKEIEINQLEKSEWFRQREIYSQRIMPNKSIVNGGLYPKFISSCNSNSIMFNWDNFIKHKNTNQTNLKESFQTMVKEFLIKLNSNDKLDKFVNEFDEVYEYIIKNNLSKIILKLFLDYDTKDYKSNYLEYIKSNIFDNGTVNKIGKENDGRVSLFFNLNAKKPYLSYMLNNAEEIHLLNSNEAEQILQLKKYMDKIKHERIEGNTGNIEYKMDFNSSTKKWFLEDFECHLYQTVDDIPNIDMLNVLNNKYYEESRIKNKNELTQFILRLLDFKVKEYYGDKDNTDNKFKTFSNIYYKNINTIDLELFKKIYKNMIKNIYGLYINGDDINKLTNILNFDICMNDYLFKTNIKEDLRDMINQIEQKILKSDKESEYIIDNDMEFYILCGQLAKYLKFKTQTDKIINKLFYEYNMATRTKQLINILQRDKIKLDYDSSNNSRSGKVLYSINNYYTINEDKLKIVDKIRFNMGLYYGDCILYVSDKKDENKGDK